MRIDPNDMPFAFVAKSTAEAIPLVKKIRRFYPSANIYDFNTGLSAHSLEEWVCFEIKRVGSVYIVCNRGSIDFWRVDGCEISYSESVNIVTDSEFIQKLKDLMCV